jgi:uncharacterized protein YecE (DUF72 family)
VTLYVGTSGWLYPHWEERFYPAERPAVDHLAYYARHFQVVEVNATFYRLPKPETFADWADRTPDDFVFALKASRYLTHVRRLRDPDEPVRRLMSGAARLGAKLGPILLQLPPDMECNPALLRAALAAFGPGVRVAVEFRNESWFTAGIEQLLVDAGAALCLADRGARLLTPEWRSAEWGYIRFHEGAGESWPSYGRGVLDERARLIARLWGTETDVFAFFNNDAFGCALRDASMFAAVAQAHGLAPTRVPADAAVVRAGP